MQQDLKLSLFNFYSPSDEDGYLRLNAAYKIRDNLRVEAGGNIFMAGISSVSLASLRITAIFIPPCIMIFKLRGGPV